MQIRSLMPVSAQICLLFKSHVRDKENVSDNKEPRQSPPSPGSYAVPHLANISAGTDLMGCCRGGRGPHGRLPIQTNCCFLLSKVTEKKGRFPNVRLAGKLLIWLLKPVCQHQAEAGKAAGPRTSVTNMLWRTWPQASQGRRMLDKAQTHN